MIEGDSVAEIDAPIGSVWELVADVERAPEWQRGMRSLRALERDAEGRALVCEVEVDARVRGLHSTVRFHYEGPQRLSWVQERGELRSVQGSWELVELGAGWTRARYWTNVDLGRLGFVIRGPLVTLLRSELVGGRAGELKRALEEA